MGCHYSKTLTEPIKEKHNPKYGISAMCSEGGWDYASRVFKLKPFLSRDLFIIFKAVNLDTSERKKKSMLDSLFSPQTCDYLYHISMHFELKISLCLQVKSNY